MGRLVEVSEEDDQLLQLIELRNTIARAIDNCESMRDLASLARQYRETLAEIERLKGMEQKDDEIDKLLSEREADGKPGAVRQDRSTV